MKDIHGIITALVTPMAAGGAPDTEKLGQLVERQIASGVHGLLALGGTAEYTALSARQRLTVVEATVKAAAGRVPVIAGVLDPGYGDALATAKSFIAAGVDVLLVLTPFYVHPTQEGIFEYYKKLDSELNFPIMVYNIPYRTNVNILPQTMERLITEVPNIFGMKECSPDLKQGLEDLIRFGDKACVMSGEEFLAATEILSGAKGGMLATPNLLPQEWVQIYEYAKGGKLAESQQLLFKYFTLFKLIFSEMNPGPLKYAMHLAGIDCGEPSLPLLPPSAPLKAALKEEMGKLGLLV